MLLTLLFFAAVATSPRLSLAAEEKEDMDTSESKSYGFGYGTKVADKYSVATVYVHGFGTDDDYAHGSGYNYNGYGNIDGYGNANHGYAATKHPYPAYAARRGGYAYYPYKSRAPYYATSLYGRSNSRPYYKAGSGFAHGFGYGYGRLH